MRSSNIEHSTLAVVGSTKEQVEAFIAAEAVAPYRDGRWGKTFRQGGPLEWFNASFGDSYGQGVRELLGEADVLMRYRASLREAAVCLL